MRTIRQSKVIRICKGACRVGDIVIFDVLGAAPRGSMCSAPHLAARVLRKQLLATRCVGVAEALKAPYEDFNGAYEDFNGEAFLIVPG